jgi:hypothetical protein
MGGFAPVVVGGVKGGMGVGVKFFGVDGAVEGNGNFLRVWIFGVGVAGGETGGWSGVITCERFDNTNFVLIWG